MSSADEVLKRQVAMSHANGAQRVAEGMLVITAVILVGSAVSALREGESLLRAVWGPCLQILFCLYLRNKAKRTSRELEQSLS